MTSSGKYPQNPIVGVGAVVLRNEKILLVKRKNAPFKGEWSIPGGKQKISETVIEAVKREIYEETGIRIKKLKFLDVVDIILNDNEGKTIYHYTIIDFKAQWLSGECRPGGDSYVVRWFKLDQIDQLKLLNKTKEIIYMALGKNFKIELKKMK